MTGMKDTDYTFAVARVRANETHLLTSAELSSLTAAPGYAECVRRLREKGYAIEGADYNAALEKRLAEMWELISDVLPDPSQFNSILIKNDFHNLKVSVKALFTQKDPAPLFARPSVYAPEEIKTDVFARENGKLPVELQHADRSAYRILSKTGFAQLADTVIDRASMEQAISIAKTADHPVLLQLAQADAALTGIKVLYRCIRAGKANSKVSGTVLDLYTPTIKKISSPRRTRARKRFWSSCGTPITRLGRRRCSKAPRPTKNTRTTCASVCFRQARAIPSASPRWWAITTRCAPRCWICAYCFPASSTACRTTP